MTKLTYRVPTGDMHGANVIAVFVIFSSLVCLLACLPACLSACLHVCLIVGVVLIAIVSIDTFR